MNNCVASSVRTNLKGPLIVSAQDYTKWKLPQGAKARLGKGYINEIAYSPDSSRLAVASSIGIWIYDAKTGEELDLFTGHIGPVERLSYSPDGRFIASSSSDKTVRLWDASTGNQIATLNHDEDVSNFVYSPDGNTIATESQGKVYLWCHHRRKATLTEHLYGTWFFSFAYSPDGRTIAIKSYNEEICLWDAETGEQKAILNPDKNINNFMFSPDGSAIATVNYKETVNYNHEAANWWDVFTKTTEHNVCLWDALTGERKSTLPSVGPVESFVYSPNGKTIATQNPGKVYLWNVVTGKHKFTLTGESFAYSPDGRTIATWKDKEIYLWDAVTGKYKITLAIDADFNDPLYPQWIQGGSLEYSPDGRTIAAWIPIDSVMDGGAVMCLWDTNTGELKASRFDGTRGLEYSPDGRTIALHPTDMNFMTLLDAVTGERKATLEHKAALTDDFTQPRFQYSPDGRTIASKSSKEVYLWDAVTGERKVTITGHTHSVFGVVYSPDGKTIATQNGAKGNLRDAVAEIYLWNTSTAKRKITIAEHPCYIFMYSPDSSTIITCGMREREYRLGDGRVIRLWDATTGKQKATLEEQVYDVESFAYSLDGSTIITAGLQDIENDDHFGRFIRLWDATTGKYKITLVDDRDSGGPISNFACNPDGKTIAVGEDGGIWLRDTGTGERKIVLVDETTLVGHGYNFGIGNLTYSPDGKTIATWKNYEQEVHLWDGATGGTQNYSQTH